MEVAEIFSIFAFLDGVLSAIMSVGDFADFFVVQSAQAVGFVYGGGESYFDIFNDLSLIHI